MKKLKIKKNTAAGILAGLMLASCTTVEQPGNSEQTETPSPSYEPTGNENSEVYGPASALPDDSGETDSPSATYEPEENVNPDVYGPAPAEQTESPSSYDPAENMIPAVYGPPPVETANPRDYSDGD